MSNRPGVENEQVLQRPGPVVEVEWLDTETMMGWRERGELDLARTAPLLRWLSVGYLVADEADRVDIVQSITADAHSERTVIPKAVVRKIRRVRMPK